MGGAARCGHWFACARDHAVIGDTQRAPTRLLHPCLTQPACLRVPHAAPLGTAAAPPPLIKCCAQTMVCCVCCSTKVLFAYEEAIGFMLGGGYKDKDGLSAAAAFCEMAGDVYERGGSVAGALAALYDRWGAMLVVVPKVPSLCLRFDYTRTATANTSGGQHWQPCVAGGGTGSPVCTAPLRIAPAEELPPLPWPARCVLCVHAHAYCAVPPLALQVRAACLPVWLLHCRPPSAEQRCVRSYQGRLPPGVACTQLQGRGVACTVHSGVHSGVACTRAAVLRALCADDWRHRSHARARPGDGP